MTPPPKKIEMESIALAQQIKILAIQAMFSDDDLLELLVLKGGNAMALVHQISARASVDLDFSLQQDFQEELDTIEKRILGTLSATFRANSLEVLTCLIFSDQINL